jgi:hypothetical protein
MTDKFTEVAGPMAPRIMRDKIASLGETRGAFPTNRLKDLLASLCKEIANGELRSSFHTVMAEKIRNLEHHIQPKLQRGNVDHIEL